MSESTELQRSIEALTRTVDQLRSELVRKDVYVADQQARDAVQSNIVDDVREVKADVIAERVERRSEQDKNSKAVNDRIDKAEEKTAANRRLWLTSLVLPIAVALILLYVAAQLGK